MPATPTEEREELVPVSRRAAAQKPPAAHLAAAVCAVLAVFQAAQSLLVEVSKRDNGGRVPFHTPSAVFYTDALKLTPGTFLQNASTKYQ